MAVQQQGEDQDQDEDETHQGHDQQEPPLLVEGPLGQRCRRREGTQSVDYSQSAHLVSSTVSQEESLY